MRTLYMIGNAHLDPVWLWTWQEGYSENKATFRSALARIDEYPDFIFTASGTMFLEWIEHNDAELFKEIKQRVDEGRIVLCGGWYVEPDCNIPGLESYIRQALYGQNYLKDKFGIIAKTGYNVDSFGHNAMLPQILKKSGYDNYVFMRPFDSEYHTESSLFYWEAPDKSKILTYRLPYTYTANMQLSKHIDSCTDYFDEGVNKMMCFYGVGNHGGGPTKQNIETIKKYKNAENQLNFASPDAFLKDIRAEKKDFPIYKGCLLHHASGCYSANAQIKGANRRAEIALFNAEQFSLAAKILAGLAYPDDFETAWKAVLFNQFHDILAGSSIRAAYVDAMDDYGKACSIAGVRQNYALDKIAASIKIEHTEGGQQIIVFNPHSWAAALPVEVEGGFHDNNRFMQNLVLTDDKGKFVEFDRIRPKFFMGNNQDKSRRISFTAKLPPLGYCVYTLRPSEREMCAVSDYSQSDKRLENEYLVVLFDADKGGVISIYDKTTGTEVLKGAACNAAVINDTSDTWSHSVYKYEDIKGHFKTSKLKLITNGKQYSAIQSIGKYRDSTLNQLFILRAGARELEVSAKLFYHEKHSVCKIQISTAFDCDSIRYEIPLAHNTNKNDGFEFPIHTWVDVSNEKAGIALINNNKTSCSFRDGTIGMTVARSTVFGHDMTFELDADGEYDYMDFGEQEFRYLLCVHCEFDEGAIVRRAKEFNNPAIARFEYAHGGSLPLSGSLLSIEPSNVIVSALKKSLKGGDTVLRICEVGGQETDFEVLSSMLGRQIDGHVTPYEIKTYLIPTDESCPVKEINMIEI